MTTGTQHQTSGTADASGSNLDTTWSSFIVQLLTSKIFIAYCVANYLYVFRSYKRNMKYLSSKSEKDVQRDKKYDAFRRMDVNMFTQALPMSLLMAPTLLFRVIFGLSPYIPLFMLMYFVSMVTSKKNRFKGVGFKAIRCMQKICSRINLLVAGIWPGLFKIEKKHVDYRKYLGPDWQPTNKTPSTIVNNHQGWLDISVGMYISCPSAVTKEAVSKIPFIGSCLEMSGCLFLKRDSKNSASSTLAQVTQRQIDVENGLYPPLVIYPEGGTSNGKQLIQFKKGAFVGLKSIKPYITKYESGIDVENCIISMFDFFPIIIANLWCKVIVHELPTFQPNDYFFANHQKEGEEKWQTYARVIREIMIDNSDLKDSPLSIEDKYAYKQMLYPSRKATD